MATPAQAVFEALDVETLKQLDDSASALSPQQLMWASGYLAGLAAGGQPAQSPVVSPAAEAQTGQSLTVLYASETGNSRRIAEQLAESARGQGAAVRLEDLGRYKGRQLGRENRVALVTATHGLGDPPDGTEGFFDYVFSDDAPRLDGLEFSVLALGDSSYDDFCEIGKKLDARLETLGGTRIHPRIDCDLDFDDEAAKWSLALLEKVADSSGVTAANEKTVAHIHAVPDAAYTRGRPFPAEILTNQKITGRKSTKDVRHIELLLEGSGLRYEPGDSLGVLPQNPDELVDDMLALTGYDANSIVRLGDNAVTLHEALQKRLEITVASRGFVDAYTEVSAMPALPRTPEARSWLDERQVIDIVAEHAAPDNPQSFVDCLRKLTPRLYSIASSPDANPDEAHLTVRMVDYTAFGRHHQGAGSSSLGTLRTVPVYVEANERFRLPADPDTPIIMIGPGTGVAPFRAFVEHRATHGATGRNWLFFGDRNQRSDFLYQMEWLRYRKDGLLRNLDVAFSRDLESKVYVQDRIRQRGDELYDWLESGAHIYVCGDADRMAPSVHAALQDVIGTAAGIDQESAEAYLAQLKKDGRYSRDVY